MIRKPRGTNWGSFREGLTNRLERGPQMNMKDEDDVGLAVHWVQQDLILAYECNYSLTLLKQVDNL
jgi:hypothetical protein